MKFSRLISILVLVLVCFIPDAWATAGWGNWRLCNDVAEDIEPVIVRNPRSNPQGVGIETTMAAYMKRIALGRYQINFLFSDGDTYVPSPGPLPLPAGYSTSGDPWATASADVGGVNPRTFYVSGTGQVLDGSGNVTTSSIFVWYLPDGSISWQRSAIATATDGSFLDKPSMTVSMDNHNLGWTWVTFVKVPPNGDNTIYLYRSVDGVNYAQAIGTFSGPRYHSPNVLIDSTTGYVFLVWLSWGTNRIYAAYSTDGGFHFSGTYEFDTGLLLGPSSDLICDNIGGPCVVARSMLNARYNPVDRSIGVVWHQREVASQRTDVYFNSFSTTGLVWRGVKKVNSASSTNDQWNAALDYDDANHCMVAWYDRRDDPNNRQYIAYATRLNQYGDRIEQYDATIGPGRPGLGSDPTVYQPLPNNTILLGEYHGMWGKYDPVNLRWVWENADIDIPWPYTQGDVWNDQIQP